MPMTSSSAKTAAGITAEGLTAKGLPAYIHDLCYAPEPLGLIAYALLRSEKLLRLMCFHDNEYGASSANEVHFLSSRIVENVNALLVDRRLRVFGVAPAREKYHHVDVHWCHVDETCECMKSLPFTKLIVNLYPNSKRAPAEDEDERSGPMRGVDRRTTVDAPKKRPSIRPSRRRARREREEGAEERDESESFASAE